MWCLAVAARFILGEPWIWDLVSGNSAPSWLPLPFVLLAAGTFACLLTRRARSGTLCALALALLHLAIAAYRCRFHSSWFGADARHVFDENTFDLLFVYPIANAGPWFLIVIYSLRAPMTAPSDDGLPYPRRYCGRCGHNLYGLPDPMARCPDCGALLTSATDVTDLSGAASR
jgi:hypothetical protein